MQKCFDFKMQKRIWTQVAALKMRVALCKKYDKVLRRRFDRIVMYERQSGQSVAPPKFNPA
jgi:hypothetical protein